MNSNETIERAVYAALGCTDTRKPKLFQGAAEQIRAFVVKELARDGFIIVPARDAGRAVRSFSAVDGCQTSTPPGEIARDLVTEWLGMFDPPPQIDFQQSEMLQAAIVHTIAARRE
jgi:hypothetical protein